MVLNNHTVLTVWGDARNGIPTPLPNNGPTVVDFEQQMKFTRTDVYRAEINFAEENDNNNTLFAGSAATSTQVLKHMKLRFGQNDL